jgi:hypothetical protein
VVAEESPASDYDVKSSEEIIANPDFEMDVDEEKEPSFEPEVQVESAKISPVKENVLKTNMGFVAVNLMESGDVEMPQVEIESRGRSPAKSSVKKSVTKKSVTKKSVTKSGFKASPINSDRRKTSGKASKPTPAKSDIKASPVKSEFKASPAKSESPVKSEGKPIKSVSPIKSKVEKPSPVKREASKRVVNAKVEAKFTRSKS